MRRSIATVSLSGTLREKLEAIAAARFDGYEMFENDLLYFNASPTAVGAMASDLGLTCDLYQPFRDFEGVPDDMFKRNLDRAERKFDVMQALGAPLMLVCSNVSAAASPEPALAAEQLRALAERAAGRNLRIGYEALAWGRSVNRYGQAWSIVQQADHPHLGLILDSFHTLSLRDDPSAIAQIPGDKIFFVQFADAPLLVMDVMQWARHYRSFPGQGQFELENFFEQVLLAGYTGPLSLEIFNDVFRETPSRQTAVDAMRSLHYLEGQVRRRLEASTRSDAGKAASAASQVLERMELFDPPRAPVFSGIAFIEFAVDRGTGHALGELLQHLGFSRAGTHRSKDVVLFRRGNVNLILNADVHSYARDSYLEHGPSVCAIGLSTDDPIRALNRATALRCPRFDSAIGPDEARIPAIRAPNGSLIYFVPTEPGPEGLFATDFALVPGAHDVAAGAMPLTLEPYLDHVALGLPTDQLDTWVLFCRAVLGMQPGESLELSDPYGLIRSVGIANAERSVRFVLNVSLSQRTRTARTVSTSGGGSVHHIAIGVADIFDSVARMRSAGVEFVPISPNYYDDLLARLDIGEDLVERMRRSGILYDRSSAGEYFHIYGSSFADRFFFEVVQRIGTYDAYGALNAPARMTAQAQAGAHD